MVTSPIPGGFGSPLGFVTTIVVTCATVAAGATTHPAWSLLALAGATATVAFLSTLGAAIATAAVAWGLHAGFVLGRHGELAFTPESTRAAAALVATALVAIAIATGIRAIRRRVGRATVTVPAQRTGVIPDRIGLAHLEPQA